jgi:hypothetical protein
MYLRVDEYGSRWIYPQIDTPVPTHWMPLPKPPEWMEPGDGTVDRKLQEKY